MSLLKEIDEQSKFEPFRLFLEDLATLDPDWEHDIVNNIIIEYMDSLQLNEIDYQAHDDMARARGARGHEYQQSVERSFVNPRSRLAQQHQPRKGEAIKYNGQIHKISDVVTQGDEIFVEFGPFQNTVSVKELQAVPQRNGSMAWKQRQKGA